MTTTSTSPGMSMPDRMSPRSAAGRGGLTGRRTGRGVGAAGRAVGRLAEERGAVGEHGVDLPPLAVRGALDPELVLLGVAAGGLTLVGRGEPEVGEPGLLGVDGGDVGDLDPEVVQGAPLPRVLQ